MKIAVQDVGVSREGREILRKITADFSEKKWIGILGPNGSGKSTLLKCIYRVLKPSHGEIWLDGDRLSSYSYRESAKKMAVMAQHTQYSFDFSVEEIVLMGRSPYKRAMQRDTSKDQEIVADALEKVGMQQMAQRSFSTLSGGEQQRVILARVLAQQTSYLILDEPTNHLDIRYQLQLLDIIKGLNQTVIAAMHNLNLAALYCDELYLLKQGEIVAHGTTEEILTPSWIERVYEVKTEVIEDSLGHRHILYHRPG